MSKFDDFLNFVRNGPILRADYEARQARLHAMLELRKTERCPLLDKWIANAESKLEALQPAYEAALHMQHLPIDKLTEIHNKLKELENA